jgi:hypothetical protein
VDKEGQPIHYLDSSEGDFAEYRCNVDYEYFNDWPEVLEHLAKSKQTAA